VEAGLFVEEKDVAETSLNVPVMVGVVKNDSHPDDLPQN